MIPDTMMNNLGGVQPAQSRSSERSTSVGSGAFKEALAGAQTVADGRERSSQAADRASARAHERADENSAVHANDDEDAMTTTESGESEGTTAAEEAGEAAAAAPVEDADADGVAPAEEAEGGEQVEEEAAPQAPVDETASTHAAAMQATLATQAVPTDEVEAEPAAGTARTVATEPTAGAARTVATEPAARAAAATVATDEVEVEVEVEVEGEAPAAKVAGTQPGARAAEDADVDGDARPTAEQASMRRDASGPTLVQARQAADAAAAAAKAAADGVPAAGMTVEHVDGEEATAISAQAARAGAVTVKDAAPAASAPVDAAAEEEVPDQALVARPVANATEAGARSARASSAASEEADAELPAQARPVEPLNVSTQQGLGAGRVDQATQLAARMQEANMQQDVQGRIDRIAEQLATRLRLSHAAGGSQVQLSLKPRELGEVTVSMTIRDGIVQATILAERPDTVRLMQQQLEELRRSLEQQGLSVQQMSVDVRSGEQPGTARGEDGDSATGTRSGGTAADGIGNDESSEGATVSPDDVHDGQVSLLA